MVTLVTLVTLVNLVTLITMVTTDHGNHVHFAPDISLKFDKDTRDRAMLHISNVRFRGNRAGTREEPEELVSSTKYAE